MATLKTQVRVNITRQTKSVARAGFNVICVVGPNLDSGNKVEVVTDLSQVADLLTNGVNDPEYFACRDIFSQNPKPSKVYIGLYESGVDANYSEALDKIVAIDSGFYGVVITSRLVVDQESAAAWVLANDRVAIFASSDANIIDTPADTANIAYKLNAAANDRAGVYYHAQAATQYLDAAIMAVSLVQQAGTYTQSDKTCNGITVDDLTPTQQTNAHNLKCNTYEELGGVNVTMFGWVASGEYFDTIHFQDYLAARLSEEIFSLKVNNLKISYDDPGITKIEGAMVPVFDSLAAIEDGGNGALTPQSIDPTTKQVNGGYVIEMPNAADITSTDKATRILGGVNSPAFTCWYSGAIHEVEVVGIITL